MNSFISSAFEWKWASGWDTACHNGVDGETEVQCVFPFIESVNGQDVIRDHCTRNGHDSLWCSTKTDENDYHLTGEWSNCGPCPSTMNGKFGSVL